MLSSVRQLINHAKEVSRTGFKATQLLFKTYIEPGQCGTLCDCTFETHWNIYKLRFSSAFSGALFLRKHDLASLELILTTCQEQGLRKELFAKCASYERKSLRRQIEYSRKVAPSL